MTSEALRLYEERVEKFRVILISLEDAFFQHLTGPVVVDGEQCCTLPEAQADLAFLLIRTGAELARAMSFELEGGAK